MTVHFIGAGPGAADLLTLRGRDIIASCPVCLYAGSLVPQEILSHCPEGARIVNTAPLDLDAIIAEIKTAHDDGQDVARLHSGDLSVWSAMGEQLRRLRAEGIPVSVTPGVPSFAAAAAAIGAELTLPGLAQSVVLTRTPGRASAMPTGESLANFAATGATLAIHLSIHNLAQVVADLTQPYGADCPVAAQFVDHREHLDRFRPRAEGDRDMRARVTRIPERYVALAKRRCGVQLAKAATIKAAIRRHLLVTSGRGFGSSVAG